MYRRIVEAAPEGIWIVDPQGRTIFSNRRMAEILGADFESMPQQSCFECVFPEELADAERHFARTLAGDRRPFDFRLRRSDGSPVWVSISCMSVSDDAGVPIGLLGLFTDITERKQSAAALQETEERFRTMADSAPVMIWASGLDKGCTFFNKVWLTFTGRSMEQELGDGWASGVHLDDFDRCLATYTSSFDAKRSFQMTYRLRRADGEYRWLLDNGVPRYLPNGDFAGYIGSCVDITDVRRTQEEAVARQTLESLGVLATGIAHDFNNLLGGILSEAELAETNLREGSSPLEEISRIKQNAIRGAEIVRELMVYAGAGKRDLVEAVDLTALVEEMLELLKISISKYAVLSTDLRVDLPSLRGNAAQIRQVVMNLVINASEAIGEKEGAIHISIDKVASDGNPALDPQREYLRLAVSDTGCGMTEENRKKIFDPFFSTKFSGRGLGLAAVQGIIRSHGGVINVASVPGEGSHFEIHLPCSSELVDQRRDLASPTAEVGNLTGMILIVEDEESVRVSVSKMLQKKGFSVMEAADGQTGVDLFRANPTGIDMVLLDMTLPVLYGHEVLEELRRVQRDVEVVITSAYSYERVLTMMGGQQPWLYIQKPYNFNELIGVLQQALKRRASRAATEGAVGTTDR